MKSTWIFRLSTWLSYYWKARNNHYLHSPFVGRVYQICKSCQFEKKCIFSKIAEEFNLTNSLHLSGNHKINFDDRANYNFMLIGDIRGSQARHQLWTIMKNEVHYNYSIDFGHFGLLFSIENQKPKQDFVLR